jgi:hypothetical protein
MPKAKPERDESLWWLAASPVVWATHFLVTYATVALWCARAVTREGPLGGARTAVAIYTAAALLAIVAVAVRSYRRHRTGPAEGRHHADTDKDRHRFLGWATFLLSGLSAIATGYVALPIFFIGTCR